MEKIKKALAQILAVLKAEPHVRKASAAFYGTEVLGLLTAATDMHVTTGEIKAATIVSVGAALAAWKATNTASDE